MSTDYTNTKNNRFAQLAKLGEMVFHAQDLAVLWRIEDKNTLYTTLKRYHKQGDLNRIYKGLYSLKSLNKLDPVLVGIKALHRYAYVSTETILSQAGIIQQRIPYITLVSSQSKKFTIGNYYYKCRQLNNRFLYNLKGVNKKNGIYYATLNRAIADLLYFNPRAYLDAHKFIDWTEVKKIQKYIGYPKAKNRYDNT